MPITRVPSRPDTSQALFAPQVPDLSAGENLDSGAACYIAANGRVYMSKTGGTAEQGKVHGFTPRLVHAGQPVTLFGPGFRCRYATGLTPGQPLYLGAEAGALSDTDTGTGTPLAFAVGTTDVVVAALQLA